MQPSLRTDRLWPAVQPDGHCVRPPGMLASGPVLLAELSWPRPPVSAEGTTMPTDAVPADPVASGFKELLWSAEEGPPQVDHLQLVPLPLGDAGVVQL